MGLLRFENQNGIRPSVPTSSLNTGLTGRACSPETCVCVKARKKARPGTAVTPHPVSERQTAEEMKAHSSSPESAERACLRPGSREWRSGILQVQLHNAVL